MWSTATRSLSISGSVEALRAGLAPEPLMGVPLDVYRFEQDEHGVYQFERLNQLPAVTGASGSFEFSDLPASVLVQTVTPGTPPYDPIEITHPNSLPNLAFSISAVAESSETETQFLEVYDEQLLVDDDWVSSHPERQHVPLTGSPPFEIEIPDYAPPSVVPGLQFHFLRVGRATRDEIGEFGDIRAGYMNSSPSGSFFPGIIDAPFARTLQIGGHFGVDFVALGDNLYYTVSFWEYSGDPALAFNPTLLTNETQILGPLLNKRYVLPTIAQPKGKWEPVNLGPFDGTITSVEDPAEAGLVGTSVKVYRRPPEPVSSVEYWPFWDLLVKWNSSAAPNGLIVLTLDVYEKTGDGATGPEFRKRVLASSPNDHLPLLIDNRRPDLKLVNLQTGVAEYSPTETVSSVLALDPCGNMPVTTGQVNKNECILVEYSVEDGAGSAHPHLWTYWLSVRFTPRGGLSSRAVGLRPTFAGYEPISGNYSATLSSAPVYSVMNKESVLVPSVDDGWPPEPNGDPPSPCAAYAAAVTLGCSVRTVDGWSRVFGHPRIERFIIIKR